MSALAYAPQPAEAALRRRHVGCDVTVRWSGSQEGLDTELRARLIPTHLRVDRIRMVADRTFVCRLLLRDPEAHLTEAAALEALEALAGLAGWTAITMLEEIDGRPAFDGVPA